MADKGQKNKTKFALPSRALQQKAALQQKEIVNSTFDISTKKEADNKDDNNLINTREVVESKILESLPEELNPNKDVLEPDQENTMPVGDTGSSNLVQAKELSQLSQPKEVPLDNSGNQTRLNTNEEKKKRGRKKGIKNGANDDKEKVDKFLKLEKYPHQIATVMAGLEGITIPSIVGKAVEQYAATNHPELLKLIKKMNKA